MIHSVYLLGIVHWRWTIIVVYQMMLDVRALYGEYTVSEPSCCFCSSLASMILLKEITDLTQQKQEIEDKIKRLRELWQVEE